MTFGLDDISIKTTFRLSDFNDKHSDMECNGRFEIVKKIDVPYKVDSLGIAILPVAPFVFCSKCEATYFLPGFEDFLEKVIALDLIKSKLLSPCGIRFLRLLFDLRQQDVADYLNLTREYYTKCELSKNDITLGPSSIRLLRLFYAKKLSVDNAEDIYTMAELREGELETLDIPRLFIEGGIAQYINNLEHNHSLILAQ